MGIAAEGLTRDQIKQYHPQGEITQPIDPFPNIPETDIHGKHIFYIAAQLGLHAGDYSDDTILSLAMFRALTQYGLNISGVVQEHIAAFLQYPQTVNGIGYFGRTTTKAIQRLCEGFPSNQAAVDIAPGNAPAMKMLAVGLYMFFKKQYKEGLMFAETVSEITHKNKESILSGVLQAHAIYTLLAYPNISRENFLLSCIDICASHYQGEGISKIEQALLWIATHQNAIQEEAEETGITPAFPVYRSYPFVIFMFWHYWGRSQMEALLTIVNSGKDADTTASIYAALAAAKYGKFYPDEWEYLLHDHDLIRDTAEAFYRAIT